MEQEKKIAVLIDAENVSSKYVETILREANAAGNVICKRIYGNWTTQQMNSWKDIIMDNAIQPIQQFNNVTGKNASDSALIIDAMDLLYSKRFSGFCIISSDSDFTRLASRLRESEMYVLGMGEQHTPNSFVSACNAFKYLDLLFFANATNIKAAESISSINVAPAEATKSTPSTTESDLSEPKTALDINVIKKALQQLTDEHSDEDGWIFSATLSNELLKQFPDFDVRNFSYLKFTPFISSLNLFDIKRGEDNPKLIYFKLK